MIYITTSFDQKILPTNGILLKRTVPKTEFQEIVKSDKIIPIFNQFDIPILNLLKHFFEVTFIPSESPRRDIKLSSGDSIIIISPNESIKKPLNLEMIYVLVNSKVHKISKLDKIDTLIFWEPLA